MDNLEIRFDEEKCTGCGLCARDCVSGVLAMEGGRPRAVHVEWCNRCSHCVAVCPVDAVSHSELSRLPAVGPLEAGPGRAEAYRAVVLGRRSVRHFKDEPVERETLEELLAVAAHSPTASNTQDVGYVMVADRELVRRTGLRFFEQAKKLAATLDKPWGKALLWGYIAVTGNRNIGRYMDRLKFYETWVAAGRDPITHNAPALVLIHAPKKGRFNDGNCHIAAANIANYAHALGLGTCFLGLAVIGFERDRKWAAELGLPEGRRVYQVLALGRPAFKYKNTAARPAPDVVWR